MARQARSFGCTIKSNVSITGLSLEGDRKEVEINGKDIFTSDSVILSTLGERGCSAA